MDQDSKRWTQGKPIPPEVLVAMGYYLSGQMLDLKAASARHTRPGVKVFVEVPMLRWIRQEVGRDVQLADQWDAICTAARFVHGGPLELAPGRYERCELPFRAAIGGRAVLLVLDQREDYLLFRKPAPYQVRTAEKYGIRPACIEISPPDQVGKVLPFPSPASALKRSRRG